jgi:predicted ABC-type ATPase
MDYNKPTLIVISGPNGAGKSTHIQSLLPPELANISAYNRDLTFEKYKRQLLEKDSNSFDTADDALQLMENDLALQMDQAISKGKHFVLETPLSAGCYWCYLDRFENAGYQIQLFYLCLDSVTDCINRVFQRTQLGGMDVDEWTIKKIYEQNIKFINHYIETFKSLSLFDGMKMPTLLAKVEDQTLVYADRIALKKNWVKMGFPLLAKKISRYLQVYKKSNDGSKLKRNYRL